MPQKTSYYPGDWLVKSYPTMRILAYMFAAISILGCESRVRMPTPTVRSLVPIASRSEVEDAVAQAARDTRAIVFVHVGWAPMVNQKELFYDFAEHWNRTHSDHPIAFHYLDFDSACND